MEKTQNIKFLSQTPKVQRSSYLAFYKKKLQADLSTKAKNPKHSILNKNLLSPVKNFTCMKANKKICDISSIIGNSTESSFSSTIKDFQKLLINAKIAKPIKNLRSTQKTTNLNNFRSYSKTANFAIKN